MKKKIISVMLCTILIIIILPTQTSSIHIEKDDYDILGIAPLTYNKKENDYKDQTNEIIDLEFRGTQFYAYCYKDPSGTLVEGPVKFDHSDPGSIIQLAPTTSNDFIFGGTWTDKDNGTWYGCEFGINGNRNIWTINNETGEMTLVGSYYPGPGTLYGLAYDPTTGIMYGCDSSNLYEICMFTGVSTLVGPLKESVILPGLAFDGNGILYGECVNTDSLYQINTSTGTATLIGPLGIDIDDVQDMAYDIDNDILYLAANTKSPTESALYTCDTSTGAATKVGTFQGNARLTGFAIQYGDVPPPPDTEPPETIHQFTPATPDGSNDWYVSNVTINLSATDYQSGVNWTNYSLNDGATWQTHIGPRPFEVNVSNGVYKMKYYSVDNKGNEESIKGPFEFKVDKKPPMTHFYSIPIALGELFIAVINIGIVRDEYSGLDRVEYLLEGKLHHQVILTGWATGSWRPIFWFHTNSNQGTNCTGIVYDGAGNYKLI